MDKTGIEWTDATWNPVIGCDKVSPGCDHCYAEGIATRFAGTPAYPNGFAVTLHPHRLELPLRWTRPRRIFVNSMSDLFHDEVPDDYIVDVFGVMARARQHTFQVLTKRHGRMRSLLSSDDFRRKVLAASFPETTGYLPPWPLPNVWLGVSVEDQKRADLRLPALLETPAAVRFLSCEPLLGPVDLSQWLPTSLCPHCMCPEISHYFGPGDSHARTVGCQAGDGSQFNPICGCRKLRGERRHDLGDLYQNHGLHWVIVGGESGRGSRPMHPQWARSVAEQCSAAFVPFVFKQWGDWAPLKQLPYETDVKDSTPRGEVAGKDVFRVGKKAAGRELDGRTWDEYPQTVSA